MQNKWMLRRVLSGAAIALALIFLLSGSTFAQEKPAEALKEPPKLAEDIFETVTKIPVMVTLESGRRHSGQMVLTYYKPQGDGPFPLVIFGHGRSGDQKARSETPRFRELRMARFFTRRGFAFFIPTRLGYGDSGVAIDPETSSGNCGDRDYGKVMEVIVTQFEATLNFAKTLPWVDKNRVVVVGQSYGGFGSIGAIANRQLATLGGINFAGGAGGQRKRLGQPCGPEQIAAAIANAGKKSKAPMLWLYAENDKLWGSRLPRSWHTAYVKAGGKAEMLVLPPVEEDGHYLISRSFRLWRPIVDRFLVKLGFAPPKSPDPPPPSDFARLEEADKLPYVKENAKTDGYQKFLDADLPRAFVVSTVGAWSWRSGEGAPDKALGWCKEHSKGSCHLYAVDDAVVFKPPATAEGTPAR